MSGEWVRIVASSASTAAVLVAFYSVVRSGDTLRRSHRREEIYARYKWRLGDALTRGSYEDTVRAYAESSAAMWSELKAQERHPWRPWRFWRLPPEPGEPWPDAAQFEESQLSLFGRN